MDAERLPTASAKISKLQEHILLLEEEVEVILMERIRDKGQRGTLWEQRLRIHYNCIGTIEIPTVLPPCRSRKCP